jgi:DUF4097 and DUF4098 domain-containing protein YvlB
MMRTPRLVQTLGFALGTACALLVCVALSHADEGNVTEEFHQTYPLAASGRVSLENINGAVHVTAWDRNEVKVDAVKRAWSKARLDDARIVVHSDSNHLSIKTEYPDHEHTWNDHNHDNPASVEYTLTVPRQASLDEIELINGPLDVTGVAGEVRASCINGHLNAHGLQGRAKLSTVNNRVEADFDKLTGSPIELESVNGSVLLTLPSDASADIEASTVSGRISNDFGIQVSDHRYVGHDLHGELGSGATRVRLENVNGRIEIRHANDNRPLSSVKSRTSKDSDDDDDDDDSEI